MSQADPACTPEHQPSEQLGSVLHTTLVVGTVAACALAVMSVALLVGRVIFGR